MKLIFYFALFCGIFSPAAFAIDFDEFLKNISYLPFEYIEGGSCSIRASFIRYELSAINVPSEEIRIHGCGGQSIYDTDSNPFGNWLKVETRYGNRIFSNHHSVVVKTESGASIIDLSISDQFMSVDEWERKTNTTNVKARIDTISTQNSTKGLRDDACFRETPDSSTFNFEVIEKTSAEALIYQCQILYHEIAKINSITPEEISIRQQKLLERTIYFWKIFGSWLEQLRLSKTEIEEGCKQPRAFTFPIFG
jgi:hypothetical protein